MIDFSFLESFTKGDTKKMSRYINMYVSMAPQTFADLESHLFNGDLDSVRVTAHSLKPQAEFMGIQGLKELLKEIESTAAAGEKEGLADKISQAKSLHRQALPILQKKANTSDS